MTYFQQISYNDSANIDAFSRLRVSTPTYLFDAQFSYDLETYTFEQVTSGTGATVTYDSTNRCALMTFSSTPTGGKAFMQTYDWIPYQPGRSHLTFVTFNFNGGVANTLKFAGLGNGTNGIQLEMNGTTLQASIYSATTAGSETVAQSSFNIDKLDGTGPSGITFDPTKTQILVIDYQALYVGRVRMGLDVNGVVYYFHQFVHSNLIAYPYIQIASLPVRAGMTCTGTVSTTMLFICSSVISEGGNLEQIGYGFAQEGTGTAGNSVAAHILSIRPKTTFNSITTRAKFILETIDVFVSGNQSVRFDLVIGQAITGTTTFNSVNAASCFEYNTAGTISGSPAVVLSQIYCASANTQKGVSDKTVTARFPITLDAAGAVRANGTISIIATGLGATSACNASMMWREIR